VKPAQESKRSGRAGVVSWLTEAVERAAKAEAPEGAWDPGTGGHAPGYSCPEEAIAGWEETRNALPEMFASRVVNDGTGMIKLDVPCIVEPHGRLQAAVEVNWPMILSNAVARLYLVADANRQPLLAQVLLIPDIVPPHVCLDIRVEDSGYVRAVVECGDGSLLEVNRWIWVMPEQR